MSLLPKRAGEEKKLFGEILGFDKAVRRRWGGEFIRRGQRRSVVYLPHNPLKNKFGRADS